MFSRADTCAGIRTLFKQQAQAQGFTSRRAETAVVPGTNPSADPSSSSTDNIDTLLQIQHKHLNLWISPVLSRALDLNSKTQSPRLSKLIYQLQSLPAPEAHLST